MIRRIELFRQTQETKVYLVTGAATRSYIVTGVPFLDHLLSQVALNSSIDFSLCSAGDILVDRHHLVEDVGITLGSALRRLSNNLGGVLRYGNSFIPLDEALTLVVLDFSGRTETISRNSTTERNICTFSSVLLFELLNSVSRTASITISAETIRGKDPHHQLETVCKSLGRSLRSAANLVSGLRLSTKGVL